MTSEESLQRLWHENSELKAEIDYLKDENNDIREKMQKEKDLEQEERRELEVIIKHYQTQTKIIAQLE